MSDNSSSYPVIIRLKDIQRRLTLRVVQSTHTWPPEIFRLPSNLVHMLWVGDNLTLTPGLRAASGTLWPEW